MKIIKVFTDGSCMKKNKIKCGYGIYFPNGELPNISRKFDREPLTNQRAELFAIYVSLIIIKKYLEYDKIIIYTDSGYSIGCLTDWVYKWNDNDWKTANDKPVKNQDILKPLHDIIKKIKKNVEFIHVMSHTKKVDYMSVGNEIADKLATSGSLGKNIEQEEIEKLKLKIAD